MHTYVFLLISWKLVNTLLDLLQALQHLRQHRTPLATTGGDLIGPGALSIHGFSLVICQQHVWFAGLLELFCKTLVALVMLHYRFPMFWYVLALTYLSIVSSPDIVKFSIGNPTLIPIQQHAQCLLHEETATLLSCWFFHKVSSIICSLTHVALPST